MIAQSSPESNVISRTTHPVRRCSRALYWRRKHVASGIALSYFKQLAQGGVPRLRCARRLCRPTP
jgi:hypothetical protein